MALCGSRHCCNGPKFIHRFATDALNSSLASVTDVLPITLESVTETATAANDEIMSGADIFVIFLYIVVLVIGFTGNLLVIVTLATNPQLRSVTNCLLLSLSAGDLLFVVFCIPAALTAKILRKFVYGSFMCKLLPWLMGVSVSISTFTMLAIALERYYAICNPLKSRYMQTRSHVYKVIIIVWIMSFIIMSPHLFVNQLQWIPIVRKLECALVCRPIVGLVELKQAWYVAQVIVLFWIPGVIMGIAYGKVCRTIFRGFQFEIGKGKGKSKQTEEKTELTCKGTPQQDKNITSNGNGKGKSTQNYLLPPEQTAHSSMLQRSKSTKESRSSKERNWRSKRRVVFMLILIVILFFVCWIPRYVANVWQVYDRIGANKSLENYIGMIRLLTYISACINPVIYCFMNKKFREGFIKAFTCCLPSSCSEKIIERPPGTGGNSTMISHETTVFSSPSIRR